MLDWIFGQILNQIYVSCHVMMRLKVTKRYDMNALTKMFNVSGKTDNLDLHKGTQFIKALVTSNFHAFSGQ